MMHSIVLLQVLEEEENQVILKNEPWLIGNTKNIAESSTTKERKSETNKTINLNAREVLR